MQLHFNAAVWESKYTTKIIFNIRFWRNNRENYDCRRRKTIRDMLGETIEKWGFTTVKVEDFDQVLSIFLNNSPHLVLMDINLPSFDGFYWCNKMRETSKRRLFFFHLVIHQWIW